MITVAAETFSGPKMYIAHAAPQDDVHHGSTRLHFDLTNALNVMLWAASQPDGTPGAAIWHIFHASDSSILRKFLRENGYHTGADDPIHSQSIYLTPSMLDALYTKYNVRPYTIIQHPGDAVFIPAGCAHQVLFECFDLF